ncbi:CoA transferase subunit A [Aminipila butyrica]|uniref:CoA transferase subunit A n=1 Tax=Aminipila butyrica TaxID=433296 RepID=A0A858C014_9FIRM|nr:3-oxoacid CoA-transferase subunit A [Aminipila butyrica]QIB70384.1 CoA transferase subunit A [Aminipila butyrica]
MSKIKSLTEAVSFIKDGDSILAGGFYGNGTPKLIVDELIRQGQKSLTIVNNDGNTVEKGVGRLVASGQTKKLVCSWCGRLPIAPQLAEEGKMELELCPQGTLAERIRCGGYGLGGVLTRTGLNTIVEETMAERVTLKGKDWLYHEPIRGNVAIIEADRADEAGNLIFHLTQRSFATVMCFAADLVIVEVNQKIEPAGSFHPSEIHVPGVVVNILVQGEKNEQ